jgi:hypothetical protein
MPDTDEPNAWRCGERGCAIRGKWQTAAPDRTAEATWLEHWRQEHKSLVVTP